ncbi:MAG: Crp/Fnr family transcriptional regulator [Elusimicrobia bacterium]|nr:Crp/Fnr family transcriptional regulator [Elusimicrobiota bacterium]
MSPGRRSPVAAARSGALEEFFRRGVPLLRGLPAETVRALAASASLWRCAGGEVLCRPGDEARRLWVVLEGRIRVNRARWNGDRVAVELMLPGDVFGLPAVASRVYPSEIVARRPSLLAALPRETVLAQLERDPALLRSVLAALGQRVDFMQSLLALSREPAERRVAATLLYLRGRFGDRLPLSRAEIAELAATTPETAMRALAQLERAGLVTKARGLVVVADASRLRRIADPA